jgi:hypothetical protein
MRNKWKGLIFIAALSLCPLPAYGWGQTAHMVIAQIGYSRLTPAARESVDSFARLLTIRIEVYDKTLIYDSISIAAYLDDITNDPKEASTKTWHFMEKPFFDGVEPSAVVENGENVEERINFLINKLASSEVAADRDESMLAAALIHLVGDIHQPLHTTSRYSRAYPEGDKGGNRFLIDGPKKRLHAYWDAAAGLFNFEEVSRPLDKGGLMLIRRYADEAMAAYPATRTEWQDMNVSHWGNESFDLAKAAYSGITENAKPGDEYQKKAQEVCRMRLAMAGYRLASLLNEMFKEPRGKRRG